MMSVILFDREDFEEIRAALQRYADDIDGAVRYSHEGLRAFHFDSHVGPKDKRSEKQLAQDIVDRCLWYCHVANGIAHMLQYKEPFNPFDGWEDFGDNPSRSRKIKTRADVVADLDSLAYNLDTNDGNSFLSQSWREVFDGIAEALRRRVIRAAQESERVARMTPEQLAQHRAEMEAYARD
jgi:hypothetical protein